VLTLRPAYSYLAWLFFGPDSVLPSFFTGFFFYSHFAARVRLAFER